MWKKCAFKHVVSKKIKALDMGKLKRMDQVRYIIKTYENTRSVKGTARRLQISKNTVREYLRRLKTHFECLSEALKLTDEELAKIVYPPEKMEDARAWHFDNQVESWLKELSRVGVTKRLLWEEYRQEKPSGYSYSQFCARLKQQIGRRDLTIKIDHTPGEKMQVDFAGKTLSWLDDQTGELHYCQVLIATMPHTQYSFAIALPSQKVEDLVHGLNEALLFFGRLPKAILSDNLKSFVVKSDKYEPDFNQLCVQLAEHYQIDLQATRVRKPKDKASVENLVSTVYKRVYAPLRNEIFHSLEDLNKAILEQINHHNKKPYQQKPGCRLDSFMEYEYPYMDDLPSDVFEIKKSTQSKVRKNYHVFIGEEKNYYSVPYKYVGRQATILYTRSTVEVFIDHQRVATHNRLPYRKAYKHQTKEEHMPRSHQEWEQARGLDEAYFISQADKIGTATHWAISYIIRSAFHPPQSFNSCLGVLKLAKLFSPQRLENACLRCQTIGKVSYSMLKQILNNKLDQQAAQVELFSPPQHDNIRGPEAYQ